MWNREVIHMQIACINHILSSEVHVGQAMIQEHTEIDWVHIKFAIAVYRFVWVNKSGGTMLIHNWSTQANLIETEVEVELI